jgi:AcrR family transcriptional regulator
LTTQQEDAPDTPTTRRPGRPRSARAERAILEATLLDLVDEGFEAMTIEGVAARAGVGKATIYRRWSGKEELVAAALGTLNADVEIPDSGNVREDLTLLIQRYQHSTLDSVIGPMIARLVGTAVRNPHLIEIFLGNVGLPRMSAVQHILERGQARGEVRQDVDTRLVIDMIAGTMLGRAVLYGPGAAASPDLPTEIVDLLLRGIESSPAP